MFNEDDFMTVPQIAADFKVNTETIRRWIYKGYLEASAVEIHRGQYFVKKEAVQVWKNALYGRQPMLGGGLAA